MIVRVELTPRAAAGDARGEQARRQIAALGVEGVDRVEVRDLVFLQGVDEEHARALVDTLVLDPVAWEARLLPVGEATVPAAGWTVEVTPLPGVTDAVAETLEEAARRLGLAAHVRAATGHAWTLHGPIAEADVRRIARGLLANEVVQQFSVGAPVHPPFVGEHAGDGLVETIALREADDDRLLAISKERRLSLDRAEMRAIRAWYRDEGREPTDVELEMLAQTWSEHCVHKTFRAHITQTEVVDGESRTFVVDSLFSEFIRAATEQADRTRLRSVFVDNAGIVAFDEHFDLAFKVETHNHPSALEPFGGANTGVGGVIRDVLGVSARPIACTDVLCFGPPDLPFDALPEGVLHPRRIADGVVAGVGDYGNKMGIPTVSGAVLYDPGYTANPLVYCGCLGILPTGSHVRDPQEGDRVVVLGGRTGRDGLRGATFSSMEMSVETSEIAGSSVQIGHPIHEKGVLEAILEARDAELYNAITDCGAGGLSSAIGEMGEVLGARVELERVPLKYPGLRPWEIWLSEAQERMVLAVPQHNVAALQAICDRHGVELTDLGTFTGTGRIVLEHQGRVVADLATDLLHHGIPQRRLVGRWEAPVPVACATVPADDLTADLLALLATPEIRSKEDIVRTFDHEVLAGTVVKPFVGVAAHGPSDASVLWPMDAARRGGSSPYRGVALSVGIAPQLGRLDPYAMAWAVIDEAFRNAVAVGADPDTVALLDNFCWGNPTLPDRLGALVRCARGCYDAALAYQAPYISGKDSLNNEYTGADGEKHAIPGTLLISALAIVEDVRRTITMDLKEPGDALLVVGSTRDERGGSAWARLHGDEGGAVPAPVEDALALHRALHRAIEKGLVRACHDASEGGLAVALAEMAIAGKTGLHADLSACPGEDLAPVARAFSESTTRYVVEVAPNHVQAFRAAMADHPCAPIGHVSADDRVVMEAGRVLVDTDVGTLDRAWSGHLEAMAPA